MQKRYLEIDIVRTIAIVMMIVFHFIFDLNEFTKISINMKSEGMEIFRIITASLFIIIAGISTNFSSNQFKRALIVIGAAILITLGSFLYDPNTFIRFGILHCIGVGLLIMIPLNKLKEINILLGALIIIIFRILDPRSLGEVGSNFKFQIFPHHTTLDYYPLFPWFGIMLIGFGIGHYLFIRKNLFIKKSYSKLLRLITFPGRHALIIYIVHQPILISLIILLRK